MLVTVVNQPLNGPKIFIANGPPHLWEKAPSGAKAWILLP
jgi:hypothetical protein